MLRPSRLLLAPATLLAAFGCARHAPAPSPAPVAQAPIRVTTAAVSKVEGAGSSVTATVHARERATLSARIAASVTELPYREGDFVAAGTILVRLEDGALRSALAAAEASAQAAEQELRRAESLLAKGAATPRELEDAQARAAAARAAVSGAKDGLAYAVLRAPFAGRIVSRPVSLGDVAGAGRTLIEIEGTTGLELRATAEAESAALLRPGMPLQAIVDGQPAPLRAVVQFVVPSADPATHRFEVRADLEAAPGVRPGLFARLMLPHHSLEERLLVPTQALLRRGGLVGAFVVDGGRARLRWIAIGADEADQTEVRAGLEAGERVALDPAALADGVAVLDRDK